jgi:hypothetical protein
MKGKTLLLAALLTGLGNMVFAQPGPPGGQGFVFSPPALPDGLYGSPYANQTLTVTGGMAPYTFSVSAGHLPAGMSLSKDGILSGTPGTAGVYTFTVKAKDKSPGGGHTGTKEYTLTVDPAVLTITANNTSMTYGGAVPALSITYSGFVHGDGTADINTKPKVATNASTSSPVGTYPITVSGAADPNYTFIYHNGTMTVKPATLTITADNKSMQQGGPLPTLTVSYAGFVNKDNASSLTTGPTVATTATGASAAGSYPIIPSGAADANYSFVYKQGTLTITPAPTKTVFVTAVAQTKEYGDPDPGFTYTVSGLANGDSTGLLTGSLSRVSGEQPGSYAITIGSLSAGKGYTINFTGSHLTITKASQEIAWSQNLVVGCNTASQLQLAATASSGLPVVYSISDASIGTISGSVLTLLKPGSAVITASQAGNGNYKAASAVTDTVQFQPASLISQHWNDALFFDNSSGDYVQWQWYKNGVAVAGDTTPYYSEPPNLDGQYFVIATNKAGQAVESCTLTIAPGAAVTGGIKVFPNPAGVGAVVTVTSNYSEAQLKNAMLFIADISGNVLQQITPVQPAMPVTAPSASGIFIINLMLSNGQRVSTNVLVR